MNIRRAERRELPELMAIFDRARRFMRESGNLRQWRGYPPEELIRADIDRGECYVMESEDGIEGVFAMRAGPEEDYAPWDGDGQPYLALHRLASAGRRKGIFRAMLTHAQARSDRLLADTHEDNRIMQGLLAGGGFRRIGEMERFGQHYYVYEWRR